VAGLAERFRLFRTYDFGWNIPALTPEGWIGIVTGPGLAGLPAAWRVVAAAAVAAAIGTAFCELRGRNPRLAALAACLAVPALLGYAFLLARGALFRTHASYDAYKLFSVFYPVLLPAFCIWIWMRRSRRPLAKLAALFLGLAAAAG